MKGTSLTPGITPISWWGWQRTADEDLKPSSEEKEQPCSQRNTKPIFQRKGDGPETTNCSLGEKIPLISLTGEPQILSLCLTSSSLHSPCISHCGIAPCIYVTLNILIFLNIIPGLLFLLPSAFLQISPLPFRFYSFKCLFHFNCVREECSSSLSLHLHLFDVKTLGWKVSLMLEPGVEMALSPPPQSWGETSPPTLELQRKGTAGVGAVGGGQGEEEGMGEGRKCLEKHPEMFQPCCISCKLIGTKGQAFRVFKTGP